MATAMEDENKVKKSEVRVGAFFERVREETTKRQSGGDRGRAEIERDRSGRRREAG